MGFLTAIWDWFRRGVGLVLPFFSQEREYKGMSQGMKWTLHVLILLIIVLGLWGLSLWLNLRTLIRAQLGLQDWWLSILFLLVYALFWLGWFLWKLLGPEQEASQFPDLDAAWDECMAALAEKGLGLSEQPLFFVLGRPMGGEEALFEAAQLNLQVKGGPKGGAPLHVYANRDGIYLTCAGASALGKLGAVYAGEDDLGGGGGIVSGSSGGDDEDEDAAFKTLAPKGKMKNVQNILAQAREGGRTPDQLTESERQEIRVLVQEEEAEAAKKQSRTRPSLIKNQAAMELCLARLRHVCRLIVRDRRPFCPINGLMVLVPFPATDSEDDVQQAVTILQEEMKTVRQTMHMSCPVFALITDMDTVPGFAAFLDRFPSDQRQRRMGQRFPLVPDADEAKVPAMIEGGVEWICEGVFPAWIAKQFDVEAADKGTDADAATASNTKLFQFLHALHERKKGLSRIVARGLVGSQADAFLLGGCYVAGTTPRASAFVPGVFRRLTENQSSVAWTPEALAEDGDYTRWTQYGYIGMGALTALIVGLMAAKMFLKK